MTDDAQRGAAPLSVVKIGGSLQRDDALPRLLADLAGGGGRAVIVPGGGPFADAVRDAQRRWRFDDARAHRMALLAMVQYGLLLTGLHPALAAARDEQALRAALAAGRVPVWTGAEQTLADRAVEASWRVSADSLAVWLARRLDARTLVLIKATTPTTTDLDELAVSGVVDAAFPDYARRFHGRVAILGPDRYAELPALLTLR